MANVTAAVQFVSLLVGIVSTIILILTNVRNLRKAREAVAADAPGGLPAGNRIPRFQGDPERSLQDLVTTLLISAVLSVTVIDALVVVGNYGSLDSNAVFRAVAIGGLITLLAVAAWYYGAQRQTFIALGFASLLVLAMARGGPFRPADIRIGRDGDHLLLFVPLFTVTAILSGYLIYFFGSLRKLTARQGFLLACPVLISAAALGESFLQDVRNDPRTPQNLTGEQSRMLHEMNRLPHSDAANLYRVASETALSPLYNDPHVRDENGLGPVNQIDEKTAGPIVTRIQSMFATLPKQDKLDFMLRRLVWIYPLGLATDFQAPLGLPGLTGLNRLQATTDLRNVTLLSNREALKKDYLKTFSYSTEVRAAFRNLVDSDAKNADEIISEILGVNQPTPAASVPDLFPMRDLGFYNQELVNQLMLPLPDDLALARNEYEELAADIVSENNASGLDLLRDFKKLDGAARAAFLSYIAGSKNPGLIVASMARVSDLDFSAFVPPKGTLPMASIATAIEQIQNLPPVLDTQRASPLIAPAAVAPTSLQQATLGASAPPPTPSQPPSAQELASAITGRMKDQRAALVELTAILKNGGGRLTPVSLLFSAPALQYAEKISSLLSQDQQAYLFSLLADPMKFCLTWAVQTDKALAQTKPLYTQFATLPAAAQEAVLHHFAIRLYQSAGPYALGPIRQMVIAADNVVTGAGLLSSFLLFLPLFLSAAYIGYLGSGRLEARDSLRDSINEERERPEYFPLETELVPLMGRDSELPRLNLLTRKNRSTIALTGRRGSGKSRILREVFRSEASNGSLALWIDCPSKYTHEDLLSALIERLATTVETALARTMGFPRLSVRTLERSCLAQMAGIYLFLLCGLGAISYAMFSALTRPEVLILWTPVWLIMIPATAILVLEVYRINPVGFSGPVKGKASYQSRILYESTSEVFRYLRSRVDGNSNNILVVTAAVIRMVSLTVIGAYLAVQAAPLLIQTASSNWGTAIMSLIGRSALQQQRIAECAVLTLVMIAILIFGRRSAARLPSRLSVVGLIQRYREYAKEVVLRIGKGACGAPGRGVVVCIDELDKISDLAELKDFLKIAKTLFDIDGVTYYLSMADDALVALALGSAVGKNEFDSSFDHIEAVAPLSIEAAAAVAARYFDDQLRTPVSRACSTAIGFASLGVPRDVVRKCETVLASGSYTGSDQEVVARIFREERREKSVAAYAIGYISGPELEKLSGDLMTARTLIRSIPLARLEGPRARVIALMATLTLAESSWEAESSLPNGTGEGLRTLFRLGYDVAAIPVPDLTERLAQLWAEWERTESPNKAEREPKRVQALAAGVQS